MLHIQEQQLMDAWKDYSAAGGTLLFNGAPAVDREGLSAASGLDELTATFLIEDLKTLTIQAKAYAAGLQADRPKSFPTCDVNTATGNRRIRWS